MRQSGSSTRRGPGPAPCAAEWRGALRFTSRKPTSASPTRAMRSPKVTTMSNAGTGMIAVKTSTRSPGSPRRRPGPRSVVATVALVARPASIAAAPRTGIALLATRATRLQPRPTATIAMPVRWMFMRANAIRRPQPSATRPVVQLRSPIHGRIEHARPSTPIGQTRTPDPRTALQRPPATSPTRIPPTNIATGNHMSGSRYFRPRGRTGIAQETTTTGVPTPAKLHILEASPTLWRTHPLLRYVPSCSSD